MKALVQDLRTYIYDSPTANAIMNMAADAIERLENEAVAWQVTVENLQAEVARYAEHLSFIERWANHHGAKSCHSAESVLGVIQHFPPITRITKSYRNGVVPDTYDIFAERDALKLDAARYRWLRTANNDGAVLYGDTSQCELMMDEELDNAIDAAMKAAP